MNPIIKTILYFRKKRIIFDISIMTISAYIIIIILLCIVYQLYESCFEKIPCSTLNDDGFVIIEDETKVLDVLPEGYVFLDYEYDIRGCTIQTFHRDVTSSAYYFNTKHPVYTFTIYKTKGKLLSVCPSSHKTVPFVWSSPKIIQSNNDKTCILFNSDLVHAGAMSDIGNNRHATQYKIVHVDDLGKFKNLQGVKKMLLWNAKTQHIQEITF